RASKVPVSTGTRRWFILARSRKSWTTTAIGWNADADMRFVTRPISSTKERLTSNSLLLLIRFGRFRWRPASHLIVLLLAFGSRKKPKDTTTKPRLPPSAATPGTVDDSGGRFWSVAAAILAAVRRRE